jgi:hypothetical protein
MRPTCKPEDHTYITLDTREYPSYELPGMLKTKVPKRVICTKCDDIRHVLPWVDPQ